MLLTSIKAKLFLGIGLLVAALLGALKIQSARLDKANRKNKTLTAKNVHAANVIEAKEKNQAEFTSRSREIARDIEEHGFTKELSEKDRDW